MAPTSQFPGRGVPEQVGIPEQFGGGRLLGTEGRQFSPRCMSGYPYSPHCQKRWRTNALLTGRLSSAASGSGRPGHEEKATYSVDGGPVISGVATGTSGSDGATHSIAGSGVVASAGGAVCSAPVIAHCFRRRRST